MALPKNINLDQPRWDQSTYWGRARHFFATTNPLNVFVSDCELDRARDLYLNYKKGNVAAVPNNTTEEDLWHAKHLYDSAFHPDTGEKMMLIGRMSAQVPMNMTITGCMMTFYKSTPAVIFWQWINQSFNALVNYTNRSGKTPIQPEELATSYVLATSGAVGTALYLNSLAKKARPIVGRFVPFAAVAAANCINIPLMRRREISQGVQLLGENGESVGESRRAAVEGISAVVFSRILMASPGMAFTPLAAAWMEKRCLPSGALFQVLFCGLCLTFATPLCCALFSQRAAISVDRLEPELKSKIRASKDAPKVVYYNKGL